MENFKESLSSTFSTPDISYIVMSLSQEWCLDLFDGLKYSELLHVFELLLEMIDKQTWNEMVSIFSLFY